MLGKRFRLVAVDQRGEAVKVGFVQWRFTADGEANAVDGQCIVGADAAEIVVKGPARHHVVLGVDLEEAERRLRFEHVEEVFGLEPQARSGRQQCRTAAPGGARKESVGHDDPVARPAAIRLSFP